ncbi:MAG: prepilin-type N-terminal cleavage/methylation domain-containing protein [Longimicrobiales bacterium]
MLKQRQGFTLIELLIVIVIIGILAAIAIPKFGATREKAYEKAMMSDLRNLQSQQELYYAEPKADPADNYTYAAEEDREAMDFVESSGVTVVITRADQSGWAATATHAALPADQTCAIFVGEGEAVAPATEPGVVACAIVEGEG